MNSGLFTLNASDLVKGLVVAIGTPVLAALASAIQLPGFSLVTYDWKALLMLGISAGVMYLIKNFLSDSNGAILGAFGGTK